MHSINGAIGKGIAVRGLPAFLKNTRREFAFSLREMASKVNVPLATYDRAEKGHKLVRATVELILETLGTWSLDDKQTLALSRLRRKIK